MHLAVLQTLFDVPAKAKAVSVFVQSESPSAGPNLGQRLHHLSALKANMPHHMSGSTVSVFFLIFCGTDVFKPLTVLESIQRLCSSTHPIAQLC